MKVNLDGYESFASVMSEQCLRVGKNELGMDVENYPLTYTENHIINVLGRVHRLESSLK